MILPTNGECSLLLALSYSCEDFYENVDGAKEGNGLVGKTSANKTSPVQVFNLVPLS